MNRPVHFEIHAADPERTAAFYRTVFGWVIVPWGPPGVEVPPEDRYWMITTGTEPAASLNGGLLVRRGPPPVAGQPVNAFVCTVGVASVAETMRQVVAAGGEEAVPAVPLPGVGWLAYGTDPDGTLFGVLQEDARAG